MLDTARNPCQPTTNPDTEPLSRHPAPSAERLDSKWFCIRTTHNAERIAAQEIALAGFEVFLPTIYLAPSPARRYTNGSVRPARPARVIPLFSRYLFTRFPLTAPWQSIRRMLGVEGFLTAGNDTPLAVPDTAIAWVRQSLSDNGCQYPVTEPRRARPRFTGGSLPELLAQWAADHGEAA